MVLKERIIMTIQHTPASDARIVTERMTGAQSSVEVIEYNQLAGSDNLEVAAKLFYASQVGMRLKQIRIILQNGSAQLETGVMQFMKGNIEADTTLGGIGGLAKKMLTNALTQETTFRPRYRGVGDIYCEPTFGHFMLVSLANEDAIIDKGLFYASEGSVDVSVAMQKNLSSAMLGGEGLFQTKIAGTGWAVMNIPVPASEVIRYTLNNEKLSVDGTIALLRKGNIEYRVEKSNKSLLGSAISGEGLLQTFTGTGEVWLAPTQSFYTRMRAESLQNLMRTTGTSHNK
ncbi:MAG: hypothetical protein RLY87_1010 [Chloroflexota bacterium]|jgi:uncharacterized protein (AIM24 family)